MAGVPVLRKQLSLGDVWIPKLISRIYDPRDLPIESKSGALLGMACHDTTMAFHQSPTSLLASRATPAPPGSLPSKSFGNDHIIIHDNIAVVAKGLQQQEED